MPEEALHAKPEANDRRRPDDDAYGEQGPVRDRLPRQAAGVSPEDAGD